MAEERHGFQTMLLKKSELALPPLVTIGSRVELADFGHVVILVLDLTVNARVVLVLVVVGDGGEASAALTLGSPADKPHPSTPALVLDGPLARVATVGL